MKAKIKEKKEVAEGTMRITFDLMGQEVDFEAGQFIYITLPSLLYPDDRGNKRHFTISSPPEKRDEVAITTRMLQSGFKRTLKDASSDFEVELGPVDGEFILPESAERPLVFLAGGIGITPYISMLEHIKAKNLPYKITLVYSNKDKQSAVYLEELEFLTKEILNLKIILSMTEDPDWPGEKRRVDANFIKEYFPDVNSYTYFVSGPPGFVEDMRKNLEEAGVENENVISERFTGYQ